MKFLFSLAILLSLSNLGINNTYRSISSTIEKQDSKSIPKFKSESLINQVDEKRRQVVLSNDPVDNNKIDLENKKKKCYKEKYSGQTKLCGKPSISRQELSKIAKDIYALSKTTTESFSLSDSLMMTFYVFNYFAHIGHFYLAPQDINILIKNFEKLTQETLDQEIKDLIKEIDYLQFGKEHGQYFVRIFAKNKEKGLVLNINQELEDVPEVKEISHIRIKDQATIFFKQYLNNFQQKLNIQYVKTKKVLGVYSINEDYLQNYKSYFEDKKYPITPLSLKFNGIDLFVSTNTIIKDVKLSLGKGLCTPGMTTEDGKPIPSIIIDANSGISDLLVSIKSSLDI